VWKRKRLKLSLADQGWKARKRQFQALAIMGMIIGMKPSVGGRVFNLLVCESDERRLAPEVA
jgi:hypothetical protein